MLIPSRKPPTSRAALTVALGKEKWAKAVAVGCQEKVGKTREQKSTSPHFMMVVWEGCLFHSRI